MTSSRNRVRIANVYVVILNWNGLRHTLECLESVYRLDYPRFSVIVVDNGSADDSVATIRRLFDKVIVIENHENLGYTGGNNVGIQHAMKLGADYVWLLNNDTVVESDALTKLIDRAEEFPRTGLLSPAIHHYDSPGTVECLGARLDVANHAVTLVTDPMDLQPSRRHTNFVLCGTALLIRREVVEAVGDLSPTYFAYFEDFDYSLRALKHGFAIDVSPDARVRHKGMQATGRRSPLKIFLMTRNAYFFWSDYARRERKRRWLGARIGVMIRYLKRQADEGNQPAFEACLQGIWAAFTARGGPYDPALAVPRSMKAIFGFLVQWHPYFWIDLIKGDIRGIVRETLARTRVNRPAL